MNRRTALKQLAIIGGGMVLLPSCKFSREGASIALDNLDIDRAQENLLADLVETFIPATDIPGGKELKLHHFVLVMVDDCRGPEDQKLFEKGLGQIETIADRQYSNSFAECTSRQKENIVAGVLNGKDNETKQFLTLVKRYTVEGFLQSKYVLSEIEHYQLVPGHFDGCVAV